MLMALEEGQFKTISWAMNFYANERAFYDEIIKLSPSLKDKIVLKCIYGRREFILKYPLEHHQTLHDTLNKLNIGFVDDKANHLHFANVPLSLSEAELNDQLVDYLPSFNFLYFDFFKSKNGNSRSVKVYVPQADWESDAGKELNKELAIRDDGSKPFKKLQLKAPYIGKIFLRLWVYNYTPPKLMKNKNTTTYTSNIENKQKYSQSLKTHITHETKKTNEKSNLEEPNIPHTWSTSYCKDLIKQNELLLEQGREHNKKLENLTDLLTQGISSVHESLKCLNEQVHQVMKRMDQMSQSQVLTNYLEKSKILKKQSMMDIEKQSKTEPLLKIRKTIPKNEEVILKEKTKLAGQDPQNQLNKIWIQTQVEKLHGKRQLSKSPEMVLKKQKLNLPTMKQDECPGVKNNKQLQN